MPTASFIPCFNATELSEARERLRLTCVDDSMSLQPYRFVFANVGGFRMPRRNSLSCSATSQKGLIRAIFIAN